MVERDSFVYKKYKVIYTILKKEITNIAIINTLTDSVIFNKDCNITIYKDNICNIGIIIRKWLDEICSQ